MSTERADYEIRLKDSFQRPLAGLETKMDGFERKVGGLNSQFNVLGGSIAGAFAGGAIVAGASQLLSKLYDIGEESVRITREFTNMRDAISFASGDRAAKNLEFLDNTIDRLGLDMMSANKGFKTFQGGLMGTSLEGEKGLKIFEAVSEASTVMKLSADQTEGVFLALGQMISKGNVQAEELRGQLGERLPGAFNIFARALGVSTQKLNKMLQDGEVIAEKTLPLFAAELKRTFSPGVAKAQDSFNSNMNRFNNFLNEAKIELGNGLIPYLNEIVTIIPKLDFSPLLHTFRQLKDEIGGVISVFGELLSVFGVSLSSFEVVTIGLRYISYLFRVAYTPIRAFLFIFQELIILFKNAGSIIQGFGEIVWGVFNRDFVMMERGVDRVGKAWTNFLDEAGSKSAQFLHDEKAGWASIFGPLDPNKVGGSSFANGMRGSAGGSQASALDSTKKGAGVEKIQSGNRNITIHINKLVDGGVNFHNTKYTESEAQMVERLKRILLTVVNDANIVAN
jgi:tape measure domain-containing protein